ncbi:MAG: Gfo/Idh/MocA family oxidoreductase, partial [Dehalococcoidia bacterium]
MDDTPLSITVIGCGLIGRRRATVAAGNPRSCVAFVVDTNEAAARALAEEVGASWTTNAAEALESPSVAAVVVATPNALLTEEVVFAPEASKTIPVEKTTGRN